MEAFLPLAGLVAASGGMLLASRVLHTQRARSTAEEQKAHEELHDRRAGRAGRTGPTGRTEGFQAGRGDTLVNPTVANAMGQAHTTYVNDAASRYNPIMNLMNPANNVLLPANYTPADVNQVQTNLRGAVRAALAVPNNPSFDITTKSVGNMLMNTGSGGTAQKAIQTCEAIKTVDCDAFNNQDFAANCGICHEGGVNSGGNPSLGGLYVTQDDLADAEQAARRMGSRYPNYTPSVGKCAPNRFTSTKEQCVALKKKMECEAKQSFDGDGCSQCLQDNTFYYISKDLDTTDPSLVIAGEGDVVIQKIGDATGSLNVRRTLGGGSGSGSAAQRIPLTGFKEGDVLEITVTPATGNIAGYLMGTTPGGDFRMDIARLIQSDVITGAKPRIAGSFVIDGDSYNLLRPGRGKDSMKLSLLNTFTFIDPREAEALECGSAPFLTKEDSAQRLDSGACFKKGQRPGAYSLECLQQTFLSAGCNEKGEGYPADQSKASALMTGPTGQQLTIGQIGGAVYQQSLTAYSGTDAAGKKLSIGEWDAVNRYCTGRRITSPCDFDNMTSGPLSTECLSYLWQNTGATSSLPGSLGPTYTNVQRTTSLNDGKPQYCMRSGTMAPIGRDGKPNDTAVRAARARGGVDGVKSFYDGIHKRANDNTLSDADRRQAIQECYGVDLAAAPQTVQDPTIAARLNSICVPTTVLSSATYPQPPTNRRFVEVSNNWIWTFRIRPTALEPTWGQVFIVTFTGDALVTPRARSPGVWLFPNSTRLHVAVSGTSATQSVIDSPMALPMNQDTDVMISYVNNRLTLKLSGAVSSEQSIVLTQDSGTGRATLFAPGPQYQSFRGALTNLSFCSFAQSFPSVLDNKAGRTKSAFVEPPKRAVFFGPWVASGVPKPVETTFRLPNGKIVYAIFDGGYTKMVTQDGEGRFYTGGIALINPASWNTYNVVPQGKYNIRFE
jgi:hypothetical protein